MCDGADLGMQTCTSLNDVQGTLKCGKNCTFDTRECDSCIRDHLDACVTTLPDTRDVWDVAIDTNARNIGVAWLEPETHPKTPGSVRFAVLGRDLSPIARSGCVDAGRAISFSLAATSSGWLLAVALVDHFTLYPLDRCGSPRGEPVRVDGTYPTLTTRSLAGRAIGGPLLSWRPPNPPDSDSRSAVLLDDFGNNQTTPIVLPWTVEAIFIGDAFILASKPGGTGSISTGRMSLAGLLESSRVSLDGANSPSLGKLGGDLYLAYVEDHAPFSSYWVRLDTTGSVTGASTAIQATFPLLPTVVVFGSWVGVMDRANSGSIIPIVGKEKLAFSISTRFPKAAVSDGSSVLVAWTGGNQQIGVARVRE